MVVEPLLYCRAADSRDAVPTFAGASQGAIDGLLFLLRREKRGAEAGWPHARQHERGDGLLARPV